MKFKVIVRFQLNQMYDFLEEVAGVPAMQPSSILHSSVPLKKLY